MWMGLLIFVLTSLALAAGIWIGTRLRIERTVVPEPVPVVTLPPESSPVSVTTPTPQMLARPPSPSKPVLVINIERPSRKVTPPPPPPPEPPKPAPPPPRQAVVTLKHMDGEDEVSQQITVPRRSFRLSFQGVVYDHAGDGVYWPAAGQGVRR